MLWRIFHTFSCAALDISHITFESQATGLLISSEWLIPDSNRTSFLKGLHSCSFISLNTYSIQGFKVALCGFQGQ